MYINQDRGLVFLAHERTASRSVAKALCEQLDFERVGDHHDGPDQGLRTYGLPILTVVRNHWDTIVSWWYNLRMNESESKPSLVWLARHFPRNRYLFRPGRMWRFLEYPNVIALRYENLDEDLNAVLKTFGSPKVKLPRVGVSEAREGRHYSEFYDSETRALIGWAFRPEIQELGYRFEEDPPWTGDDEDTIEFLPTTRRRGGTLPKDHGPMKVAFDAYIVTEQENERLEAEKKERIQKGK